MSEKLTRGLKELVRKEAGKAAKKEEKMESKSEKRTEKSGGGEGNWIKGAIKHPGALHAELGVPEGKKIPAKKMERALHSQNPTMRKQANLANTLKNFKRKM